MNIMSIDPGLAAMGIYIYKKGKEDVFFTIKAKKDWSLVEKLKNIRESLIKSINENKIDVVVCEDYAITGFKRASGATLAEVKGVIKYICNFECKIKGFILMPISTWKSIHKKLGLPKNKTKKYVEKVNKAYDQKFKTPDETDAYLMLVAIYRIYKGVCFTDAQIKIKKRLDDLKVEF